MALATGHREQRRHPRIQLCVPAKFLDGSGIEHAATLLDISAGGLALTAAQQPEIGAHLIIYIDELGRVEGRVVRHLDNGFAIQFDTTDKVRQRLATRLENVAQRALQRDISPLKVSQDASDKPRFTLADGREFECRVVDLSVRGVWLDVGVKPALGEEVTIGRMRGRVSRHHPKGVEIEFLNQGP